VEGHWKSKSVTYMFREVLSFKKNVFYNNSIEFTILTNQGMLFKLFLNEIYNKVRTDKSLSDSLPIRMVLNKEVNYRHGF
jgi:hypothetical protein